MAGTFKLGDILEMDGLPCVVVGLSGQTLYEIDGESVSVPKDHIAVWFGADGAKRRSEGGPVVTVTDVWNLPEEYFGKGPQLQIRH